MGIIYKNGIAYGNQPSTDAVAMIEPSEEASATSAHAYAVGDHFIYNGTLYRATAAIAIGDTITPDTNCVATNVMTEVESGGGGGGGTSDYTQLSNKPQINGNTLTGNKTGADLGLVNAVTGKQLSTEDYTTAEKTKLAGIEAQANKTVIDDTLTNTGEAADAKAVGDEIGALEDITGDGQLSGFTATDLTGAANELKNTLNSVEAAIAYVQSGDAASRAYTAGEYVYLKNHPSLAEGLYTVDSEGIPIETSVTGHLTADSSGGLNKLNDLMSQSQAKSAKVERTSATSHTFNVPSSSRHFFIASAVNANNDWAGIISASSTGTVTYIEMVKGSNVTQIQATTNSITIELNNSAGLQCIDFYMYGSKMT